MKDNWKTTAAGVATILVAVGNAVIEFLKTHNVNVLVLGTGISTGLGLIHASDSKPAAGGQ